MDKTAFITGASSGIGEQFAKNLAAAGYDTVLLGRKTEKLSAVSETLKSQYGVDASYIEADLSKQKDLEMVDDYLKNHRIDLLVNNAGFGHGKEFMETDRNRVCDMLNVHVYAPTIFTHTVLSQMKERGSGIVVNVSSLAAFMRVKGATEYVSTKAYLVEFSVTLDKYLKSNYPGIRVQVLCPGFTHTEFHSTPEFTEFDKGRFPKFVWMDARRVVDCSLENLNNRKNPVIPGAFNKFLYFLINCPVAGKIIKSL